MKKPVRVRPFLVIYDGEHFIPHPRFKRMVDQQFAVHEEVALIRSEERSMSSHRGYFASLHEGYLNLAEVYAQEFDSEEHLRHWCLCKEGYCTRDEYELNTADDARTLRIVLKAQNKSTIVRVEGNKVIVYTPESQAVPAMGKERFEASKIAVLARVASMANTTPAELKKNAGGAA